MGDSWEEIRKILAETARRMAESDAKAEKRLADDLKRWAEADAKAEKRLADDLKRWAEAEKHAEKRWAEAELQSKKLSAQISNVSKNVNGISKSNGLIAENYFYESLHETKTFGGVHYDDIQFRMHSIRKLPDKTRLQGEYDVVMINDEAVCLIETKYRVEPEDVQNLVNKQVSTFKILFPDFADYKYYLGIGGWFIEEEAETEARKHGVGLLKLKGDAVVINDENLKVY